MIANQHTPEMVLANDVWCSSSYVLTPLLRTDYIQVDLLFAIILAVLVRYNFSQPKEQNSKQETEVQALLASSLICIVVDGSLRSTSSAKVQNQWKRSKMIVETAKRSQT